MTKQRGRGGKRRGAHSASRVTVYRAAPRPRSTFGQEQPLTATQRARPDIPRERCDVCKRPMPLRADGTLIAHKTQHGVPCIGAEPRASTSSGSVMCEHGNYPRERKAAGCGCPAR